MAQSKRVIRIPFVAEVQGAIRKIRGLDREIDETTKKRKTRAFEGTGEAAQKETREVDRAFRRLYVTQERDARRAKRQLMRDYLTIKRSGTASANEIRRAYSSMQKGMENINRRIRRDMESTFRRAARQASEQLSNVGSALSVRVSAPAGLGLAAIIRDAGNFEEAMGGVAASIQGLADEEFQALSKAAQELGRTTRFSAGEAAGAIEVLARNGLSAKEILEGALQATVETSAASGAEIKLVADLITDLRGQFALTADELGNVGDVIVGAAQNSKFAAEDLVEAFANGGSVAGSFGIELNDFAATIAATSTAFSSGAAAGTAFRTFLLRLTNPTGEAAQVIQDLGIDVFRANGDLKSMGEIARELERAFAGMTTEQAAAAQSVIFGSRGINVATALIRAGADGIQEAAVGIANGNAQLAASIRESGLNGALRRLRSALEGLAIAIGESGLIEVLTDLVERFTGFITRLAEAPKWVKILIVSLLAFLAVLGPLLVLIGQIGLGLLFLGPLLSGLGPAVLRAVAVIGSIPVAIGAALLVAGALIIKYWDEIRNAAGDAWRWIRDNAVDSLKFIGRSIVNFLLFPLRNAARLWNLVARGTGGREITLPGFNSNAGFKTGGYTGAGDPNAPAGIVHRGEYVNTAAAVQRWGLATFEALERGVVPRAFASAAAGSNAGRPVVVNLGGREFEMSATEDVAKAFYRHARDVSRGMSHRPPGFVGA